MEIKITDKRVLEKLALVWPHNLSKKYTRIAGGSFIVMIIGAFVFFAGYLAGLLVVAAGLTGLIYGAMNQDKEIKAARQGFIKQCELTGTLPELPEETK